MRRQNSLNEVFLWRIVPFIIVCAIVYIISQQSLKAHNNNNNNKYGVSSRISRRPKLDKVCKANKTYTITSFKDLWDNLDDLHCIFHLGYEPLKVPVGPFHGELITAAETRMFNPLARLIWLGKLVTKVHCNETTNDETHLGWNYFAGPLAPFVASVGPMKNITHTSRIYSDDKSALFFDYTPNLRDVCPKMNASDAEKYPIKNFSPYERNFWPFTHITDILRPVGKQEDGGIVYLGQMYAVDIYRSDRKSTPVCFFAAVNYDEGAVPFLKPGDSTYKFEKDTFYTRVGLFKSIMMFTVPINFVNEPIHTTKELFSELYLFGKNFLYLLKDFLQAPFNGVKEELQLRMKPPNFSILIKQRREARSSNYISVHEIIHSHRFEL